MSIKERQNIKQNVYFYRKNKKKEINQVANKTTTHIFQRRLDRGEKSATTSQAPAGVDAIPALAMGLLLYLLARDQAHGFLLAHALGAAQLLGNAEGEMRE